MTRRIFRLGGLSSVEREVDDELAFHLDMRTRKLIALGMPPDQAATEARRRFGDLGSVRDHCITTDRERERSMRRITLLDEARQDLRHALRMIRHNPVFSLTIVVMLALGIGANTSIFTLVNAILLRNLPVAEPGQLIVIGDPSRTSSFSYDDAPTAKLISYPLYRDLRDNNGLTTGLLASGLVSKLDLVVDDTGGEAEHPRGRYVSGNYFHVLGVPAALGRTFDGHEDDAPGSTPIGVISEGYWQSRFQGDPHVLGRTVRVNGTPITIVGVTPRGFSGEIVGTRTEIWLPLPMRDVLEPNVQVLGDRNAHWLQLIGRMRPGVTLAMATSGFTDLVRRLTATHAPPAAGRRISTMPVPISPGGRGVSRVRSIFGGPLLTLMAGVGLLLLICCANAANLMLARAAARTREMSVRVAIGAGRFRLVRQLLTESLVLALLGAAGGLGLAWYASHLLLRMAGGGSTAIPVDAHLDLPVLGFTAMAAVLAVVLSGLAPAWTGSHVDLASAMRGSARTLTGGSGRRGGRLRFGAFLIAGQVALSLVLLVGAALLVRSLRNVQGAETGMDREHVLTVDLDPTAYSADQLQRVSHELRARFARLSGVVGVTYSENGLFNGHESATELSVQGFVARTSDDSIASYDRVGADFVRATGATLMRGRDLTEADRLGAEPVALVNESFARYYFGSGDPIGAFLRFDSTSAARIVGVIADIRDHSLVTPPLRRFYTAYDQPSAGTSGSLVFLIRTSGDPAPLARLIRHAVRNVDPDLPINTVATVRGLMAASIQQQKLLADLSTGFGVLALLLAAFGLYGLLAYAVSRRTAEIGLRMALGAPSASVVRLILWDAVLLVGIGTLFGVPLSIAGAGLLRNQLHGISTVDPVALVTALTALLVSALVAALFPALRASRVDPLTALRQE